MEDVFCIYALIDPRDNTIKYIGQTEQTIFKRLSQHIYYTPKQFNKYNEKKYNWIQELKKEGLEPDIKVLYNVGSVAKDADYFEYLFCFYYKYILNQELYNDDIAYHCDLFPFINGYKRHQEELNVLNDYTLSKEKELLTFLNYPLHERLLSRNSPIEDYSKLPAIRL